jgi:hypothetical protein
VEVVLGSRQSGRLLKEVGKARKILSANESTDLFLECFDAQERDHSFKITRAELDDSCSAVSAQIRALAVSGSRLAVPHGVPFHVLPCHMLCPSTSDPT